MTAEPRDVEGRCGFTIIDRDGMEQPCDRPATGWRWYQDCDHEDTLDVACDRHENEGGRRLAAADRDNAELRASNHAMIRLIREHGDVEAENAELRGEVERLQRRLFPGQGESYTNEVERQRVVIDQMATIAKTATAERNSARAQLAAAQAQLAGKLLERDVLRALFDSSEAVEAVAAAICPGDYCEAHSECRDCARAALVALADIADGPVLAALPAAPQPEPDSSCGNCGEPFPGEHVIENDYGNRVMICPKHTALGSTMVVHDGFIGQCDLCAVHPDGPR